MRSPKSTREGGVDSNTPASRVPLTRERVLRAAVALADEGGIGALSMRKLATELRVEAMSLYNHVQSKDDVLDGMVDLVVTEIEVPSASSDWKAAMRRRAVSAHTVLLKHPWAPLLLLSRVNVGPAMLRYIDATLASLRVAGFSFELADRAWNAMDCHIYGYTLQQLNFPFDPSQYQAAANHFLPLITESQYPYLRALTVLVSEGTHRGVQDFEFGLELILEGLDRRLSTELQAAPPSP
jgi:AcrR family transcriptional regulator